MENWKLSKAKEREIRMSFDDVEEKKFKKKESGKLHQKVCFPNMKMLLRQQMRMTLALQLPCAD